MKKHMLLITVLLSIVSCQLKSDCYGGRIIIDEIITVANYEKWQESQFVEKDGKIYVSCNFPDTLTKNQSYTVNLKLLKTEHSEKWVGTPSEIVKIEIQAKQKFESLEMDQKSLFTGGSEKNDEGEKITIGLNIEKTSELELKYEFTELIDWKRKRELKGTATKQESNDDKIETLRGEYESAFRFVDSENNVVLLVTKDFKINECKSRLIENNGSKISGLMFNK